MIPNNSLAHNKLQSAREICPKCKRKGLGYAGHPHAFGFKDYDKASCRYCRVRFQLTGDIFETRKCIVP